MPASPTTPEAYCNLGNTLQSRRESWIRPSPLRSAKPSPLEPRLRRSRTAIWGTALHGAGRFDEAACAYRQAIALKPQYAQCTIIWVLHMHAQGKFSSAIDAFQPGHRDCAPPSRMLFYNLGNALSQRRADR